MTPAELRDRALAALPGGRAQFDPITLLVLSAIVGTIIARYVTKAMDKCEHKSVRSPGFIARWHFRRAVRAAWSDPDVRAKAAPLGLDDAALDRAYGDGVHRALLAAAASLTDDEINGILR